MKIVFNRQDIANAMPPLMCATGGKSTLTTVDGILIEAHEPDVCVLTTYDTTKGLRCQIEARVIEGGSYIINAQKFLQTIRVMNGEEITLTIDDRLSACISCGRSSHRMSALKGSDFPNLPELKSELGFEMPQSILRRMIGKTMYAMGVSDQRAVLNGCFFRVTADNLMVVACDSFRLAKCSLATSIENRNSDGNRLSFAFIIPSRTISELYKLLSDNDEKTVRIYMLRTTIIMEIDDIIFFSNLITGEYIDFDRIIIENHKINSVMDRDELLSALERAALVTEEKIAGSVRSHVKLEFGDGLLKISANSAAGSTYDEIETENIGGELTIAFNNRYLIESLRSCEAGKIRLSLSSPLTSMNIEPLDSAEEEDDLFMLLPVRMKD